MITYGLLIMNYELSPLKLVALGIGLLMLSCVVWCFFKVKKYWKSNNFLQVKLNNALTKCADLDDQVSNYKTNVAVLEKAKTALASQRAAVGEECKKKNQLLDQQSSHIETLNQQVKERDDALRKLNKEWEEHRDMVAWLNKYFSNAMSEYSQTKNSNVSGKAVVNG